MNFKFKRIKFQHTQSLLPSLCFPTIFWQRLHNFKKFNSLCLSIWKSKLNIDLLYSTHYANSICGSISLKKPFWKNLNKYRTTPVRILSNLNLECPHLWTKSSITKQLLFHFVFKVLPAILVHFRFNLRDWLQNYFTNATRDPHGRINQYAAPAGLRLAAKLYNSDTATMCLPALDQRQHQTADCCLQERDTV